VQGGSVLAGLGALFVDNQFPSAWRIILPMNLFVTEENMKSPFIVRRQSLRTRWQSIVGIASTNSSFDGAALSSRNNSFRAPIKWR
jgi:hypothetical protein